MREVMLNMNFIGCRRHLCHAVASSLVDAVQDVVAAATIVSQ